MGQMVMPWGKHRGKPVAEIDPDYLRWMRQQPDLARRFTDLAAEIDHVLDRSPAGPDDSTAHNEMALRFLDRAYALRVARVFGDVTAHLDARPLYRLGEISSVEFEEISDVRLGMRHAGRNSSLLIELKPQVGEDWPQVLRQAKEQRSRVGAMRGQFTPFMVLTDRVNVASGNPVAIRDAFALSDIVLATNRAVEAVELGRSASSVVEMRSGSAFRS